MAKNEQLTPSVVQVQFNSQVTRAFRRIRTDLGIESDVLMAQRLRLPGTFAHYLSGARDWPVAEACKVAALGQVHMAELLELGDA